MKRRNPAHLFSFTFLLLTLTITMTISTRRAALACGGFFCTNSPVDQNAERIIFTQNRDGTVSAIVQIQYTGTAEDFSWVLPVPSPLGEDDLEIPEDAMAAFNQLELITNPVYIPPPLPEECEVPMLAMEEGAVGNDGNVTVFSSGSVGPFGFDVVGSEDPTAMIFWLRDNGYQVTEPMEPLIDVYVQEGMYFLAMRLLPDKEASDVEPIKITYETDRPMIPLRLTAVAANPDMRVLVYIYADRQAVPVNYAHVEIPEDELTFFAFGGNDYRQLMSATADEFGGQAFVTEYAGPAHELPVTHPLLQELASNYAYVTRLSTVISPEEMTVDPVFDYDPQRRDVSNVHDLSDRIVNWDCLSLEEQESQGISFPFVNADDPATPRDESSDPTRIFAAGLAVGCAALLLIAGLVGMGVFLVRRVR